MAKGREMITGNDFKRMVAGAYQAFLLEHEHINELNVFPVPDGDTGTNMLRTLGAVAGAVAEPGEEGIGSLAKRAADSAVMGARGNSGVILSQIFRGLGRGLAGKQEADSAELGKAFQYGVLYAYRAVAKPVEGTILTVAKGIAKGAYHAVRAKRPIADILEEAIEAGGRELARTPELLPALKEAGVVDAGGRGLIVFMQGCLAGLGGNFAQPKTSFEVNYKAEKIMPEQAFEIVHPYCTEFLIKDTKAAASEVREVLGQLGDSLIVADGGSLVKVHVHTAHPGLILEKAVGWGTLHDIKIENMADQHSSILAGRGFKQAEDKIAVISVTAGQGFEKMMRDLGAKLILSGGQSMNPSVEEFMDAMHAGAAENYIILPNNRNVVLAAAQAKKLLGDRAEVVPALNMPQGIAALMAYDAKASMEENVKRMTAAAGKVKAAALTRAVRDSRAGDIFIRKGMYIGVIEGKVRRCGESRREVLAETVQLIAGEDCALITLYYGYGITVQEANECANYLMCKLPQAEIEVYEGGQPLYAYIVSAE